MLKGKLSLSKAGLFGFCLVLALASCATESRTLVPAGFAATPQPGWTRTGQHASFPDSAYLTAVGSGASRQAAERDALGRLVSIFGIDVRVDVRVRESYRNMGGGGAGTHQIEFDEDIVTGAGMDNLIGVEVGDSWSDGRNSHALVVMNRARATQIYTEMIRANLEIIDGLTNMPAAERNTLGGFSRHQTAAVFADMNTSYAALLSVIGSPQQGLRRGDDFRREAQEIAAAIPISININNDRAGRIQSAFARSFSDLGFRTGGANQRYALNVNIVTYQTDHQNVNVFARMLLSADLTDTRTGAVLLPYSFNHREGHTSWQLAEDRAFMVAEQLINGTHRDNRERNIPAYRDLLEDFLFQLIPQR